MYAYLIVLKILQIDNNKDTMCTFPWESPNSKWKWSFCLLLPQPSRDNEVQWLQIPFFILLTVWDFTQDSLFVRI